MWQPVPDGRPCFLVYPYTARLLEGQGLTGHTEGARFDNRTLVEHLQMLRRYARMLVSDPSDADDLVQETMKRILTYLDGSKEIVNLRAYLLTVLHNVRADMVKRRVRAGEEVSVDDVALIAPDASASDRTMYRQVLEAVHRLPEEHRRIILLVGLEGMSYRETAEILGLPIGTVMSRLSRARAALRQDLGLRQFEAILEVT